VHPAAKQVEIFSGTGGVGKTTLATSRANYLAQNHKRVLLITIDPAKRLKQILGIEDKKPGELTSIKNLTEETNYQFDAILMSPDATFERLAKKNNVPNMLQNRILAILTKPYGGLNEILSIVELNEHIKAQNYDVIVLDTPPGPHFLDFLESTEKIQTFFDQTFIDIFDYLTEENKERIGKSKKFVTMLVSSGVKKLLSYLQRVTGASFIEEFVEAVSSIYKTKDSFLDALNLQKELKKKDFSNWFLVTSVEQNKFKEALDLQQHASHFIHEDNFVILNKSQKKVWQKWQTQGNNDAEKIKSSFLEKEQKLTQSMKQYFPHVFSFDDVLAPEPIEHVRALSLQWSSLKAEDSDEQ
jgi:anion-transporting  ArsA/GET3 family ATPase